MRRDISLLIAAVALGGVGGVAAWRATVDVFAADLFRRRNYRDRDIPVAVGVLIPVVVVAGAATFVVLDALASFDLHVAALTTFTSCVVGFGLLGLLDDLAGDATDKGFAGHLRALGSGRLTTGATKLFGGAALSVLVAAPVSAGSVWRLLLDGALIALAANLANLFDRAPGRVIKVSAVAAVPVVALAGADARLMGAALVLGVALALLGPDLGERLMLGDSGANVLGATLGLAVVLTTAPVTRSIVLVVMAILNVASERVSFSRVIEATPPLRWVDRIGRGSAG